MKTAKHRYLLDRYRVYDSYGNLKYRFEVKDKTFEVWDRDMLYLYDSEDKRIGSIKERLFSIGVPLLEKEVKKCSVYLGKEKICQLKKYKSFGELEFEDLEGSVKIKYTKDKIGEENIKKLNQIKEEIKNGKVVVKPTL